MTTQSFSKIIEEVRKRPELWCKSHDAFRNRPLHKKTWRQIAAALKSDESLIRKRWKHLKDQYRKELKKAQNENAEYANSCWMHFSAMEFIKSDLLPPRMDKTSQSPIRSDSDDEDIDQSEFDGAPASDHSEITHASRQILKMTGRIERHIKACDGDSKNDPDYMFLMSIMPSMKKLSEIQKLVFRGKVNDWLLEAMTQNEYNEQCDTDSKYFLQSQVKVECQEGAEMTNLN